MSDQKTALVTGGSRGIGRAIVELLAQRGYRVMLTYRANREKAEAVASSINASAGQAQALQADVADARSATIVVQSVIDACGRLDVLVNNAGTHLPGVTIADTPAAEWDRIIKTNLYGPFHLVQAALPHMRARRSGNIVNISSNVTQRFPAAYGAYTVSKTALDTFTRILSKEEGPNGIRINAVAPGPIRTDMLAESLGGLESEKAQAFTSSVPLRRAGEPREIAEAVAFLVSDAASYMTGQIMYVNGGGPGG
jgi:NAD(P)-dependent dehydrogenase (short-subunit alcohol dehydrogenase family)